MKVYEPGTTVWLHGHAEARVTAVTIRPGPHVTYDVAFWANGSRTALTVEAWEVEEREVRTIELGFLRGGA